MADFLAVRELPDNFNYPKLFVRVAELGLINFEPWQILDGELLRGRYLGIRRRYPDRILIPFAMRQDNDDVACWEGDGPQVVIIHDFASPGWERRVVLASFAEWLRLAVEDMISFE